MLALAALVVQVLLSQALKFWAGEISILVLAHKQKHGARLALKKRAPSQYLAGLMRLAS